LSFRILPNGLYKIPVLMNRLHALWSLVELHFNIIGLMFVFYLFKFNKLLKIDFSSILLVQQTDSVSFWRIELFE
jgi:formate/nitrite transporter FocA (FNT family)